MPLRGRSGRAGDRRRTDAMPDDRHRGLHPMLTAAEAHGWTEHVVGRYGGLCAAAGDGGASCTRRLNHGRDHYDVRVERGWRGDSGVKDSEPRRRRGDERQQSLLG